MEKKLLIIGGIVNILLGIFHLLFWELFNWSVVLECIPAITRGAVIEINITLSMAVFIFGYISIFHHREMLETKIGRTMLLSISLLYFVRAATGAIFFPFNLPRSFLDASLITVVGLLYLIPFLRSMKR